MQEQADIRAIAALAEAALAGLMGGEMQLIYPFAQGFWPLGLPTKWKFREIREAISER